MPDENQTSNHNDAYDWALTPKPHWKSADTEDKGEDTPQFVAGRQSNDRIRIRYFQDTNTREVWAHVRFGFMAQGPPGFAHGGSVAAVLDEAMGVAAWQSGLTVVAAELNLRYKAPTPLYEELLVHAWIDVVEDKIARLKSSIARPGERDLVLGKGRFVNIGKEKYRAYAKDAQERRKLEKQATTS